MTPITSRFAAAIALAAALFLSLVATAAPAQASNVSRFYVGGSSGHAGCSASYTDSGNVIRHYADVTSGYYCVTTVYRGTTISPSYAKYQLSGGNASESRVVYDANLTENAQHTVVIRKYRRSDGVVVASAKRSFYA